MRGSPRGTTRAALIVLQEPRARRRVARRAEDPGHDVRRRIALCDRFRLRRSGGPRRGAIARVRGDRARDHHDGSRRRVHGAATACRRDRARSEPPEHEPTLRPRRPPGHPEGTGAAERGSAQQFAARGERAVAGKARSGWQADDGGAGCACPAALDGRRGRRGPPRALVAAYGAATLNVPDTVDTPAFVADRKMLNP